MHVTLPRLRSTSLIALAVAFMALFENHSFWSRLFAVVDLSDPGIYPFLLACFLFIFGVSFIFLAVFAVGPLLRPLTALVLIIASITAWYMDNFGTVFDDVMIRNIVETNVHEAMELFSFGFLLHVLLFGLIPVFILYRLPLRRRGWLAEAGQRLLAIVLVLAVSGGMIYATYKDFTFVFREHRQISFFVNPVFPLRAVYRYGEKKFHAMTVHFQPVFADARRLPAKTHNRSVLVIVVGETARVQQFHLGGYARQTTPELEKRDVLFFSDVKSCGTATAVSLPCMFSVMTHAHFNDDEARAQHNLLDALAIAGYQVMWRENNPDCKGVCARIDTQGYDAFFVEGKCDGERCYDEALLHGLKDYIATHEGDLVIVLHTQGSHGPAYYRRYPRDFARFTPDCQRPDVHQCSRDEVVNAYDNTILYTDYFLAGVIDFLQTLPGVEDTAMVYVSDHGESLGEKGVYLHGLPYLIAPKYQTQVPMIMWFSPGFARSRHLDMACLHEKQHAALSHDNFLHSILGLMDVVAQRYQARQDIFASCRR